MPLCSGAQRGVDVVRVVGARARVRGEAETQTRDALRRALALARREGEGSFML